LRAAIGAHPIVDNGMQLWRGRYPPIGRTTQRLGVGGCFQPSDIGPIVVVVVAVVGVQARVMGAVGGLDLPHQTANVVIGASPVVWPLAQLRIGGASRLSSHLTRATHLPEAEARLAVVGIVVEDVATISGVLPAVSAVGGPFALAIEALGQAGVVE